MKKFLLVVLIVLFAVEVLAACAPIDTAEISEVAKAALALPTWLIILGAVVLFLIGFGIIWKLVPGFIKFLAVVALAIILAGAAYGVWRIAIVDKAIEEIDQIKESYGAQISEPPNESESDGPGIDIDIHIGN